MKKVLLIFAAIIIAIGVQAQNANRGGFFLELGIGSTVGDMPRIGFQLDKNNTLYAVHTAGAKFDVALGARAAMKNRHWAYELRLEFESTTEHAFQNLAGKLFPIAFRYTSGELFGNMSLYATFGLGAAVSSSGKSIDEYSEEDLVWKPGVDNEAAIVKYPLGSGVSVGPAYTVGVGLNITNHLYAGFAWDAQMMINSYRAKEAETLHYGSCGFRLGYRF